MTEVACDNCPSERPFRARQDIQQSAASLWLPVVFAAILSGLGTWVWSVNERMNAAEKNQVEIIEKVKTLEKQFETQRQDDRLRHEQLTSSIEKRIDKLEYKIDRIGIRGSGSPSGIGIPSGLGSPD